MSVLINGAVCFVGSHISFTLKWRGDDIVGLDKHDVFIIEGDLNESKLLAKLWCTWWTLRCRPCWWCKKEGVYGVVSIIYLGFMEDLGVRMSISIRSLFFFSLHFLPCWGGLLVLFVCVDWIVNTKLLFIMLNLAINSLCKIPLPNLICISLVIGAFYGASKFSFGSKFSFKGINCSHSFENCSASQLCQLGFVHQEWSWFFHHSLHSLVKSTSFYFEGETMDHLLAIRWVQGLVISQVIIDMDCC